MEQAAASSSFSSSYFYGAIAAETAAEAEVVEVEVKAAKIALGQARAAIAVVTQCLKDDQKRGARAAIAYSKLC